MASTHRKRNGIFYTPSELAYHLVKPLINKPKLTVFDPAYGEGSLLLAAEKIYKNKYPKLKSILLYGCDKLPKDGLLKHLPNDNFIKQDFFQFPINQKFDGIVSNPPFVRHHLLSNTNRIKYQRKIKNICEINRFTDLWGYFLIKSTSHLKEHGCLAAILPWSFLQADYALPIREFLIENSCLGSRH
jgi:adenine-specific DNA-methyltransferase